MVDSPEEVFEFCGASQLRYLVRTNDRIIPLEQFTKLYANDLRRGDAAPT